VVRDLDQIRIVLDPRTVLPGPRSCRRHRDEARFCRASGADGRFVGSNVQRGRRALNRARLPGDALPSPPESGTTGDPGEQVTSPTSLRTIAFAEPFP